MGLLIRITDDPILDVHNIDRKDYTPHLKKFRMRDFAGPMHALSYMQEFLPVGAHGVKPRRGDILQLHTDEIKEDLIILDLARDVDLIKTTQEVLGYSPKYPCFLHVAKLK